MKFFGAYIAPAVYERVLGLLKRTKAKPPSLDVEMLRQRFDKSGYEKLLTTFDLVEILLRNQVFSESQLCILIPAEEFKSLGPALVKKHKENGVTWLVLSQNGHEISGLCADENTSEVLYVLEKKPTLPESVKDLTKLRVAFPYDVSPEFIDETLNFFVSKGLQPRASDYFEFWPLAEMSLWYDPDYEVLLDLRNCGESYLTSVIIPFQDNASELKHMLKNLFLSLENHSDTEVLIIDDSFETSHTPEIAAMLQESGLPMAYIKLHRPQARQRGDFSFRAGVSRNTGAFLSRGKELVFVDSDMVIGQSMWIELARLRQNHQGLAIPRRHFLIAGRGLENKNYDQLRPGQDTQLSWGGHWEDFYRDPSAEKNMWKWVSTYCLAVSKTQFMQTGGFRRDFYCYGFEDTDLGYRLEKQGWKLQVANIDVFHMPLSVNRSEYAQDSRRRKALLKKSFEVFLRSSLDFRLRSLFRHVIE